MRISKGKGRAKTKAGARDTTSDQHAPRLPVAVATVEMGEAAVKPLGLKRGRLQYQRVADGAILEIQQRSQKEGGATHLVNVTAHPLDWYHHRKAITREQFTAADRLRRDFLTAGRPGLKSTSPDNFGSYFMPHDNWKATNKQAEAMRRLAVVMEHMGRVSRIYLEHVVCRGEWANDVAKMQRAPERYGMERLREALDDLAYFYKRPDYLQRRLATTPELEAERRRVLKSPTSAAAR